MDDTRTSCEAHVPDLQRFLTRPVGSLVLAPTALAAILGEGWARWPNETGGVLLGRRLNGAEHSVVVHQAIGPGPSARNDRGGFEPDTEWQAAQVATAWAANMTLEYLGDWHTHPGGTTGFSELDRATARTIATAPEARQPRPVMLVAVLQQDLSSRMAAAVLLDGRLRPLRTHL